MKNFIFYDEGKKSKKILYITFLISFSLIAYYILNTGYSMSPDSTRFAKWADELIKVNFNFFDFYLIDKDIIRPSLFFFSVPVFLIAVCKFFFINDWQFAFLILNLSLLFFSLIIFVKSLLLIGVRFFLIAFTLPIIVLSVDILLWPQFILSDTIYASLVIFATYLIIKGIVHNKIRIFELSIIIFLLLATRPASIPVVFAIIFFIIISKIQIFSKQKNIMFLILGIITFTPLVLGLTYLFIELNFHDIPKLEFLTSMVKVGMIIHDRPETWVDPPDNFFEVLYIYFLRLVNFFNPYASTFSMLHILLNMFQTFIILLSILIWVYLGGYIKSQNKIFFFIIILSISVGAFHSFILIDFDWRYRFPILLPLIILFPISLENILNKIKFK